MCMTMAAHAAAESHRDRLESPRAPPASAVAALPDPDARQTQQFDTGWSRWDNPTMILTLDAKRRLTVPANLAPAEPGDHFIAEFDPEEDAIVFRRLARRADWLAVLRACPVEMDDVPLRSRQLPKHRRL